MIESRRLSLRPIDEADLPAIVALHRDPRVIGLLVDGIPNTRSIAAMLLRWNVPMAAQGYGTFAVRRHGDAAVLGLFSLTPFGDDPELLELGGRLAPDAWRGGLAVEAGAALIDHAFGPLERVALMSAFHPDNRSVPAALGRLGFVDAGHGIGALNRNVRLMRLDRSDWTGLRPHRRTGG